MRSVQKIQIFKKIFASLSVVLILLLSAGNVYADQFDDAIAAAKQQAADAAAQAATFHAQASDAQTKLNQLNAQIRELQTQINLNEAQSAKLIAQIADAQAKLANQKAVLADIVKTMYFDSSVSPIEMLASSQNISDFLDTEQYRETIKTKIQSAMDEIQKLKKSLEDQQTSLAKTLEDQKSQQIALDKTRNEAAQLLALYSQNAASADQQVRDSNAQVSKLRSEQAIAIAAASHHISGGSGCGGYPAVWCNSPQDSMADSWGMYNRECVSYAAWATAERFGHTMPYWGGRGNANQWPGNARASGIPVDNSPHIGDVAIYMGGAFGHAMIVEQVKSSTVIVSSFNADNTGHYSVDEWQTSSLYFIHFR